MQNPQRKLKQGIIYSKTNRTDEAYKLYEEILFSEYGIISMTLNGLYMLCLENRNFDKAHLFTAKQEELAKLFEMGKYHEVSCRLDLATAEKDIDTILDTMEIMVTTIDDITSFSNSPLYEHMDFKKSNSTFLEQLKQELLNSFQDKETYGFLEGNERWHKLIQK